MSGVLSIAPRIPLNIKLTKQQILHWTLQPKKIKRNSFSSQNYEVLRPIAWNLLEKGPGNCVWKNKRKRTESFGKEKGNHRERQRTQWLKSLDFHLYHKFRQSMVQKSQQFQPYRWEVRSDKSSRGPRGWGSSSSFESRAKQTKARSSSSIAPSSRANNNGMTRSSCQCYFSFSILSFS